MIWVVVVVLVIAAFIGAAAWSDLRWKKRGFRTEIRGSGRNKVKVRVRLDHSIPMPEDPNLLEQDWVRMRDLDEPDGEAGAEPRPQPG